MPEWLRNLLGLLTLASVLAYLVKKFGDTVIDAVKEQWKKSRKKKSHTAAALVAAGEIPSAESDRHQGPYVSRGEETVVPLADAVARAEVSLGHPSQFLIVSGPEGIGKTRCCVELAPRIAARWINLQGHKASADALLTALEDAMQEGKTYIYDDYDEYRDAFGKVVDLVIRRKAKLVVTARDEHAPERDIAKRATVARIQLGKLSNSSIEQIIRNRALPAKASIDGPTMGRLVSLAEGVPGLALVGVDHYVEKKTLHGIQVLDDFFGAVWRDFEQRFGATRWPEMRAVLGQTALVRGLSGKVLETHWDEIKSAVDAGQAVLDDKILRLWPDLLNSYVARKVYFEPALHPRFESDVKTWLSRSREILTTVVYCGHRQGAAIVLKKASKLDARTAIDVGLIAYDGFRDPELLKSAMGDFWLRVDEVRDPDYHHRVATLLHLLGMWNEAEGYWHKALGMWEAEKDWAAAAAVHRYLGHLQFQRSAWQAALECYEKARATFARATTTGLSIGIAATWLDSSYVHQSRGEWEHAFSDVKASRKVFEGIVEEQARHGTAETNLAEASLWHNIGQLNLAIELYDTARAQFEQLNAAQGLARACVGLALAYADKGDWERMSAFYEKSKAAMELVGDRHGLARIVRDLAAIYVRKNDWTQAETFYDRAEQISSQVGDARGVAEALLGRAEVLQNRGQWEASRDLLHRVSQTFEQQHDDHGLARAELSIGVTHLEQGDRKTAIGCFTSALDAFQRLGDRANEAIALIDIGIVRQRMGDYTDAARLYERAREALAPFPNSLGMAHALLSIGSLHASTSDWDAALKSYQESLKIAGEIGNARSQLRACLAIGAAREAKGEWALAMELYQKTWDGYRELADLVGVANTARTMAGLLVRQGEWDRASACFAESRRIAEQLDDAKGLADGLFGEGAMTLDREDAATAVRLFSKTLALYERLGDRPSIAAVQNNLGMAYRRLKQFAEALAASKAAIEMAHVLGDRQLESYASNNTGAVLADKKEWDEALPWFERSLGMKEELGDIYGVAFTCSDLGAMYLSKGDWDDAEKWLLKSLGVYAGLGTRAADATRVIDHLKSLITEHQRRGNTEGARRLERALKATSFMNAV